MCNGCVTVVVCNKRRLLFFLCCVAGAFSITFGSTTAGSTVFHVYTTTCDDRRCRPIVLSRIFCYVSVCNGHDVQKCPFFFVVCPASRLTYLYHDC